MGREPFYFYNLTSKYFYHLIFENKTARINKLREMQRGNLKDWFLVRNYFKMIKKMKKLCSQFAKITLKESERPKE